MEEIAQGRVTFLTHDGPIEGAMLVYVQKAGFHDRREEGRFVCRDRESQLSDPRAPLIKHVARTVFEELGQSGVMAIERCAVDPGALCELLHRKGGEMLSGDQLDQRLAQCLPGPIGTVTLNGEPVKLTAQEYKLLSYLLHHKGKVVSRTELIEHIYDQDFDRDSNTIEVFVTRIRKKLGADVITTIRGLGYSLDDPALGRG